MSRRWGGLCFWRLWVRVRGGLARRAEVLERVAGLIDEGRVGSPLAEVLPSLTADGCRGCGVQRGSRAAR